MKELTKMQLFFLNKINESDKPINANYLAHIYYESIGKRRHAASRNAFGQTSAAYRTCRKLVKEGLVKEKIHKTPGGYTYSEYEKIEMKEFEVWTEGYAATGQSSGATFHGKVMAENFDQACIKLLGSSLDKDKSKPDGYARNSKGNMRVWACGCYDNEAEAREFYG